MHAALAIFFLFYFPYINNKYPNDPEQGIELSIREHLISYTLDDSGNVSTHWTSNQTNNPSIKLVQRLMIGFFLITSGFHFYYYYASDHLNEMIRAHNNYVRWIEYSITATIMLYIIALLSGLKDKNVYLMIGVINVAMMSQGQLIEQAIRKGESVLIPMITGFALMITEFLPIIRSFTSSMDATALFGQMHPTAPKQQVPNWIKPMIYVLFLFFACFGFVSLYASSIGKDGDYESIEKIYVVLSLVAKTSLGIFVAYGSAQRQTGSV